jgi:signal transduction histidine kinase
MLKMLRRLIGENIIFTWQPGAKLHLVRADPSQINQVVANLCITRYRPRKR